MCTLLVDLNKVLRNTPSGVKTFLMEHSSTLPFPMYFRMIIKSIVCLYYRHDYKSSSLLLFLPNVHLRPKPFVMHRTDPVLFNATTAKSS